MVTSAWCSSCWTAVRTWTWLHATRAGPVGRRKSRPALCGHMKKVCLSEYELSCQGKPKENCYYSIIVISRSRCHCHITETLQTSRWLPLQWVLPARRWWVTSYKVIIQKEITHPFISLPEYVRSLPDGSYVSVPSPLGKIKSMTKGSEVEWSEHFSHTPLTADMTHTVYVAKGRRVDTEGNNQPLNLMKHRFKHQG